MERGETLILITETWKVYTELTYWKGKALSGTLPHSDFVSSAIVKMRPGDVAP